MKTGYDFGSLKVSRQTEQVTCLVRFLKKEIFRVNLQFSVRAQKYTLLLGYKKNIISDFGIE